jgi:hypothetical protein
MPLHRILKRAIVSPLSQLLINPSYISSGKYELLKILINFDLRHLIGLKIIQLDLQIGVPNLNEWSTARNTQFASFTGDAPVQCSGALEGFPATQTVGEGDTIRESAG